MTVEIPERTVKDRHPSPIGWRADRVASCGKLLPHSRLSLRERRLSSTERSLATSSTVGWIFAASLMLALAGCVSSSTQSTTHVTPPPVGRTASSGNLLTRWLPGHRESTSQLIRLHQRYGQWQEQLGNLTEARKSYEYVLGESPKSTDAIIGLARIDHLAGRDPQAEQGFLKAIRLKPNDPRVHEAAGEFYASQKRWSKAIAQLNSAMMAAPTEPSYRYQLAVALARSGDLTAAMPHFVQSVGEAEAHYNIGYILFEKGDEAGAEQHFVKALALRPDLTQAQTMLADLRRSESSRPVLSRSDLTGGPARQRRSASVSPVRRVSAAVPGVTVTPQRPLASGSVPRQPYHGVTSNTARRFSEYQPPAHRSPASRNAPLTPEIEQRQNQLRGFSGNPR